MAEPRGYLARSLHRIRNAIPESANKLTNSMPLHALIIGINNYQNMPQLNGAVRDAESIRKYLTEDLAVPSSQITTLLDDQATRKCIIDAFRELLRDPRIGYGDPILIYFAGRTALTEQYACLCPQDFQNQDSSGQSTAPIASPLIANLLNGLSKMKGDNITMILDCCHAANCTSATFRDKPQELRSHILLAACGSEEAAFEDNGQGQFTVALLKTLRQYGFDKITYKGLMHRLPDLYRQNPQCKGLNMDRTIFGASFFRANRRLILIKKRDDYIYLNAGTAQGITVGAVLDVYANHFVDTTNNRVLGTMRVHLVEPIRSRLTWVDDDKPFEIPDVAYGYQVRFGHDQLLRVHFTTIFRAKLPIPNEWDSASHLHRTSVPVKLSDANTADVVVDLDEAEKVVFNIRNKFINHSGVRKLPQSTPATAEHVLAVLRAALEWIWSLNCDSRDSHLDSFVNIEFTQVRRNHRKVMEAIGGALNSSNRTEVYANPRSSYGLRIFNNSPCDLYAHLFCFNLNELSIERCSNHIEANSYLEPMLPKRSSITLGYGSRSSIPFTFEAPLNQEPDIYIFKLYVTNSPGDFSSIELLSPFDEEEDRPLFKLPSTNRKQASDQSKGIGKYLAFGQSNSTHRAMFATRDIAKALSQRTVWSTFITKFLVGDTPIHIPQSVVVPPREDSENSPTHIPNGHVPPGTLLIRGKCADIWVIDSHPCQPNRLSKYIRKVIRTDSTAVQNTHQPMEYDIKADVSVEKFRLKAKQWVLLTHAHVVDVLGYEYPLTLEVEFCSNGCVRDYLKGLTQDRINVKRTMIKELVLGMCYLHEHVPPVVHESLSAGKLLLDHQGHLKIGEFSLASLADPPSDTNLSRAALTLRWTSPELVVSTAGMHPSPRTKASDIWALGCTLFEVRICFNYKRRQFLPRDFEITEELLPYARHRHDYLVATAISHGELAGPLKQESDMGDIYSIIQRCWSNLPSMRPDMPEISRTLFRTTFGHEVTEEPSLEDVINRLTKESGIVDLTDYVANACSGIAHPIHQTGLSDIYRASMPSGRQLAIKCLRERNNKRLKHTARELYAWSKLKHTNILELLGLAQLRGCLAMVSPWVEQGSVRSVIKERPGIDRYSLCEQLATIVLYLHGIKVVHGDLKGANVLLAANGTLQLTDFGLAVTEDAVMTFTQTDPGGGTIRWMAPELLKEGGKRCAETDMYALGMTMLEIITGRDPFYEINSGMAVISAVGEGCTPQVPELKDQGTSPRALLMLSILYRCWRYKPHERASAEQVLRLIKELGPY